jgi:dolichol-phosphate mannosyltransferase
MLGAVAFLRVILAWAVPLAPEEAYHWNFAAHLDWSYFDHPPMIAWAIATGRALLGETPLGVRFVPILFSIGTAWVLAVLARGWYGEGAAMGVVLLLAIEPVMTIASGSGFPDSPLLFFWALTMALVWKALSTGKGGWWLWAGSALGAAMFSKYTAVFLVPSVFLCLLLSPRNRRWLATPWPYLAGAVALAVFTPVVLWNASHGWVSFRFQSVRRFEQANEIRVLGGVKFLAQQWLGILPLTLPLAAAAARRGFRGTRSEDSFLLWCSAPIVVFFFALSFARGIHLLWPLPGYLGLTVLMAGTMAEGSDAVARMYAAHRGVLAGISTAVLLGAAIHLAFFLPFVSPYQGFYGWSVVAQRALEIRSGMAEGTFYLGLGRKYTVPSQVAFHLRAPDQVHGKNLLGIPDLQYDFWSDPRALVGRDAVVILEGGDREPVYRNALSRCFGTVEEVAVVQVPVGRRTLVETAPLVFVLLRGRGYRAPPETLAPDQESWPRGEKEK